MPERWLTYQQMGELFGMSPEAARQRARRLGWRTQPGNDGRTLVLVPPETDVQPRSRPAVQTPDQTPGQPVEQTGDGNALAELLRAEIERADAATQRAAKAEGEAA